MTTRIFAAMIAVFTATAGYAAASSAAGSAPARALPAPPAAYAKCASCHTNLPNAGARVGPALFGVGGARAGARPGFAYSQGLRESEAPGTAMPPQNLTPAQADAVADYLMRLK